MSDAKLWKVRSLSTGLALIAFTALSMMDRATDLERKVRNRMRPSISPQLRAEFKEMARDIIAADRLARRYGRSQNTIGEIEQALFRTHLLGRTHDETPPVSAKGIANGAIDWILIPPRARDTLWSMTFIHDRIPSQAPDQLLRYVDEPRIRWRFIRPNGLSDDSSVADDSVRPLVRLGLLSARE